MPRKRGIVSRINRAFLFQGGLIAVAAILGVFFAKLVIEEILVKNAILEEEEYFWDHYSKNRDFPLPDTKNLTGFFETEPLQAILARPVPDTPGFHEYANQGDGLVLHISERNQRRLYLLYYRGQVDGLVLYYGLFPLLTVLLILYLALWLTYRWSRRTVSPISNLADQIDRIDFSQPELSVELDPGLTSDDEIQVLADAINDLGERLGAFIMREQNFTRDASHELRSPLTVISIATDLLLSEQELSGPAHTSVLRIKRAITDMERLTELFLMLAREQNRALTRDKVNVNAVITEEIERARLLNKEKELDIKLHENQKLMLWGSDMVLAVLFGNLIRNALLHGGSDTISILIEENMVEICDRGRGMPAQQIDKLFQPYQRGANTNAAGYGVGLTIVKRLSDRFGWSIDVTSEIDQGTCVTVDLSSSAITTEVSHQMSMER